MARKRPSKAKRNTDATAVQTAVSRRGLSAAHKSTVGLQTGVRFGAVGTVDSPPSVTVTPTAYPDSPQGTIIVQNYVAINIHSDEFSRFNKNIEALLVELRQSNEISGEFRDQLVSKLKAGRELAAAPKPPRDLINVLLVRPLKWLAEKSGSSMISKLAGDALEWLLKIIL